LLFSFAFLGFWTKEKRDEHLTLLKGKQIQDRQLSVHTTAHNQKSLKKAQSYYMTKPYGDELKTICIFGLDEKTLSESQCKVGGIWQTFRDHCKVRFTSWFDAELALISLKSESFTMGFSFEYEKLKHRHTKLIEKLKLNKRVSQDVFVKTEIVNDNKSRNQQNVIQNLKPSSFLYLYKLPRNLTVNDLKNLSTDIKEITFHKNDHLK
jgi:hypothetical protein